LSPKQFEYDIIKVNNYARVAFNAIRSASQNGQEVSNQEALFYLFTAYKKIKSPRAWLSHITFLERQAKSIPNYPFTTLMAKGAKKYSDLKDTGELKPSDKSPEEHILAMLSHSKGGRGGGWQNNSVGETKDAAAEEDEAQPVPILHVKSPPFSRDKGEDGDTKEWDGKTWRYCAFDHKDTH
jgi:hypothetical protein